VHDGGVDSAIDEAEFERRASDTLGRLETALAECDDTLEVDLAMGVLTIEYEDGTRHVINSHRAARQIWAAAGATAWHFDWTGEAWIARKSDEELWAVVRSFVSRRLGRVISLQPI
jgi:CyaY protein